MNMHRRIREKRKQAGLTQKEVADYFGIKGPSVSEWESGITAPSVERIPGLARLLRTSIEYLISGKEATGPDVNVEAAITKGKLPLISWVQAGEWAEIVDNFQPGDAEEWIPCPFNHTESAFILQVVGWSMHNPSGDKSYSPGEFIAVDPGKEPRHKSMVIAKVDGEEKATFKQLLIDPEGAMMLKALNPDHRPNLMELPADSRIVGVVIGKWTPE